MDSIKRGKFFDRKGQMNMSFGWIFAIIVGAFILFLTIFGITKFMSTTETQQQSVASEDLTNLLNPLESSFESATSTFIERNVRTRIENNCRIGGEFGKQALRVSEESVGGWADTGLESEVENRYVFSNETVEGKRFWFFTKPFEYPFKVADLIYLTSAEERYCFVDDDLPSDIEDEVSDLNQNNLAVGCSNWTGEYKEVCFNGGVGGSGCDVEVNYDAGTVKNIDGNSVGFYTDSLMYAAIFSDEETYKCQVARLMKRSSELADLYAKKTSYSNVQGCSTGLSGRLEALASTLDNHVKKYEDDDAFSIDSRARSAGKKYVSYIKESNDNSLCRLW